MPKTLERPLSDDLASRRMLSVKETMAFLGVSKRTLNEMTLKWSADTRVPSYIYKKPGLKKGSRRYALNELEWWREKHREPL